MIKDRTNFKTGAVKRLRGRHVGTLPNLDPSTWDPALDAVAAAPANHKLLFENENLRALEVISLRTRRSRRIILDGVHFRPGSVQGPIQFAPDGTQLPPNRDFIKASKPGTAGDAWSSIWRLSPPVVS